MHSCRAVPNPNNRWRLPLLQIVVHGLPYSFSWQDLKGEWQCLLLLPSAQGTSFQLQHWFSHSSPKLLSWLQRLLRAPKQPGRQTPQLAPEPCSSTLTTLRKLNPLQISSRCLQI